MKRVMWIALFALGACAKQPAPAVEAPPVRERKPDTGLTFALDTVQESPTRVRIEATVTTRARADVLTMKLHGDGLDFDAPTERMERSVSAGSAYRWVLHATRKSEGVHGVRLELDVSVQRGGEQLGEATETYVFGVRNPSETARSLVHTADGDELLAPGEEIVTTPEGQRLRESIVR